MNLHTVFARNFFLGLNAAILSLGCWTQPAQAAVVAGGPPAFSKAFEPATIGPGSVSTLRFRIDNSESSSQVTDLAFSDVLPAGVSIADPAKASSTCVNALVAAPPGGSAITLSGARVGALASCEVVVDVTSATPGTHQNLSGDLTSSAGNSGPAAADLTVATDRPGFLKSFAPQQTVIGGTSTLTFVIDNSANPAAVTSFNFLDNLPPGLRVADPAVVFTTCGTPPLTPTITATAGGNQVGMSYFGDPSFPAVAAAAICVLQVEAEATQAGLFGNTSGELSATVAGQERSVGKASATLQVEFASLTKRFIDDPVAPSGTVRLRFTVINADRDSPATAIAFTDDLDATLSGLVAVGLPRTDVCGAGSTLTGTSLLDLSGGTLPPGGSCSFEVELEVPTNAPPGSHTNTTDNGSMTVDGSPVLLPAAIDALQVNFVPVLSKRFLTNPAKGGDTVTMEFTVTNSDPDNGIDNIAFSDNLSAFMAGVGIAAGAPASDVCGSGSLLSTTVVISDLVLTLADGSLPAGGSCTFSVDLLLPGAVPVSPAVNRTSPIAALRFGEEVLIGQTAQATLTVLTAPQLSKSFTDDPVAPGGTVTLEFTLRHAESAPTDATGIGFTDDLGAVLTGMQAIAPLPANPCGPGSTLTGTSVLTLSGGTLAPGGICTFAVTVQVPSDATAGTHTNTTSAVNATVSETAVSSPAASDDLVVTLLQFSKAFIDDPAFPGGTVTLRFTVSSSSASPASGIAFVDDLTTVLDGLTATGLPLNDICGPGSSLTGTTTLILTGGSLPANGTCSFDVTLAVPTDAAPGDYRNRTGTLLANLGSHPGASDTLTVGEVLSIAKSFIDDPVDAGDTVTLRFTLSNASTTAAVSDVAFSDVLGNVVAGLSVTSFANNNCGGSLTGTGTIALSGGLVPAGGTCQFDAILQVPANAPPGSHRNTTSTVTGTWNSNAVSGAPAADELVIRSLRFTKSFGGIARPGGTQTLSFSITNLDPVNPATRIGFSDDLSAVLTGLTAVGLPAANVCGIGSSLSGTSVITLINGMLPPGGTCNFEVTVQVPANAPVGSYLNVTSALSAEGVTGNVAGAAARTARFAPAQILPASPPATATLTVALLPAFSKVFSPQAILTNGLSTLTFTIDNTGNVQAATSLAFVDNLPAGVSVAPAPNATTTCSGGILSAAGGSISYAGGSVGANTSCTVSVDVTATAAGNHTNTTDDLTSTLGNSGTATHQLSVSNPPVVGPPAPIPGLGVFALLLLGVGLAALAGRHLRRG